MSWYKDWFNSPYYHILYGKRDEREAESFVSHLLDFIKPSPDALFLDLACGKGRHSRMIADKGYSTYGIDLSTENIQAAREFESEKLKFEVYDMRDVYRKNTFDCILNLFTSFGYFKEEKDNLRTLHSVSQSLKQAGLFVQDYFNVANVKEGIKEYDEKNVDGITFKISKRIEGKFIHKTIEFFHQNENFKFQERVALFEFVDFEKMYADAGLEIQSVFGDYSLNAFDIQTSDRLIIISKKVNERI